MSDANGCTLVREHQIRITSSVSELEIDGVISVLPIPTTGIAHINFELSDFEKFKYQLINNHGQVILRDEIEVSINHRLPIDLRNHPDGIYYFILEKENAWRTWRILKQR